MIRTIFPGLCLVFSSLTISQAQLAPELRLGVEDVEFPLRFLSSDEMGGRRTGSPGNELAARFIASYLQSWDYATPPGQENYFQVVPFRKSIPAPFGTLKLGKQEYKQSENLVLINSPGTSLKTKAVFAGYGWIDEDAGHNDYQDIDVEGKLVIVLPGTPESQSPQAVVGAMAKKREWAQANGAAGLIELYRLNIPWQIWVNYFGRESISLREKEGEPSNDFYYGWIKEDEVGELAEAEKEGKAIKAKLEAGKAQTIDFTSPNVMGILEGSDPELKNEYVILTAHFDHVGIGREAGGPYSPKDSIFNGARDNAFGTVALLNAAKCFAQEPPARSIIILAVTGEEIGLLGSRYYADHPIIPLEKTVFNVNTDGAGYNNTQAISVFGHGRTGIDEEIESGSAAVDLEVVVNPAPEQNLFDRSDNVSFAAKGVPALTISPGLDSFDEEIGKYYHQTADEAESVDMEYFLKYCQAFIQISRKVANKKERPFWVPGDKYEEAGKKLYNQP